MKVVRPFKHENPRNYQIHYLVWPGVSGIAVNLRDTGLDDRIGLICSLGSLSMRDHAWSSDEHFELVASALLPLTLQDSENFSLSVDWRDGGVYELSDLFPECVAILAIRESAENGRTPHDYLPSLLKRGFLSYSGDARYCDFVSSSNSLGRELKVKPISGRFAQSGYVRHLFDRILPRETSPLGYFVASYQVLELLMQEVFQSRLAAFKQYVADFDGGASDLRSLNQKLAEVAGERERLRVVFEDCQVARTMFPELTSACEELVAEPGGSAVLLHDLVYQVRNKILHSLREISEEKRKSIEAVNRGLNELIAYLLCWESVQQPKSP